MFLHAKLTSSQETSLISTSKNSKLCSHEKIKCVVPRSDKTTPEGIFSYLIKRHRLNVNKLNSFCLKEENKLLSPEKSISIKSPTTPTEKTSNGESSDKTISQLVSIYWNLKVVIFLMLSIDRRTP